jgi:dipeptidyl aminopeptidase/acylaminoacyl peptidase
MDSYARQTLTAALLGLGLGLGLVAGTLRAEEVAEVEAWSPELQMQYRQVRDTALSPDGSLVAFVVREAIMEEETSEYRDQLWVARSDGSWSRQFTFGDSSSTAPAFSPDGRWLAFLRVRGAKSDEGEEPKTQIHVLPVAGGEGRVASEAETGVSSYAWSPDGSAIAYLSVDSPSEEEEAAEKEKRDVDLVDQSFDYAHLWLQPFDPTASALPAARRLTEGEKHLTELDWSPEGDALVVAHQPDPRLNTGMIAGDLAVVEVESGAWRPLVERDGKEWNPRWSPDAGRIAFASHGGAVEAVGLGDVWTVSAEGGELEPLARTPNRDVSLVDWVSEDELLVVDSEHTARPLYLLPDDGGSVRRIGDAAEVLGVPSVVTGTGLVAHSREDAETPEDVFVTDLADFASRRVSELHSEVPRPAMGRTEVVRWRSPDGLEIEGLLTWPVNHREGDRVPLVLNIHGGPAGVYSHTFTGGPSVYMLQTFAERGYAILRPNPRGSTGYGKKFRYANVRDWCVGDYADVTSGVDAMIERGVADPERLYVMGWSYGGYMTSCVVSRTDRFRAASMGAGLPNLVSMVHTTDIPDYLVAHLGGSELWQDFEAYWRHSPMSRLDRIVTPTQVVHGQQDLRVPYGQGVELYVALDRKGVPTELVSYPRTPHGPREPKFLMDVSERILAWFERFAPGGSGTEAAGSAD